jgi:nucleotide-binding universal stress UspA family protein
MSATSAESLVSAARSYLAAGDAVAAVGGGCVGAGGRARADEAGVAGTPRQLRRARVPAVFPADLRAGGRGRRVRVGGGDGWQDRRLRRGGCCSVSRGRHARGLQPRVRVRGPWTSREGEASSPEHLLDRVEESLGGGVHPRRIIRAGDPPREILAVAQEWGADLIVLGVPARGAVARLVLGSTPAAVMRRAYCAVLTVGHEPQRPRSGRAAEVAGGKQAAAAQAAGLPPGLPPGGPMWVVERHLDALVAIVRRTTSIRIESYLAEILDDVCTHCERQFPSRYCPLRYENTCALFSPHRGCGRRHHRALKKMEDPEYWFNHPVGSADLAVGGPAH